MSQKETLAKDSLVIKQAKLVFLGESSVGKSSIILRFANNEFQENKEPTVGAAFVTQKCRLEDKIIKFEIWDTAGRERFHSLAQMYYRNAHVAVVVYDVTNMDSFNRAKSWIKELNNQANPNIIIALLGNKIDLSRRQVSTEIAKNYALEFGLLFYEISARKDHGIREVFTKIVKLLCEDSSLERKSKDFSLEQKSKDSSLEQKSKDSSLEQKSKDSILEQKRKYKKIIWVKFNEEPIKIAFNGEDIFDLIEEAKIKLNGLDKIKMDLIEVYKHNSVEPLKFGQVVDDSFINRYETPVEIKVKSEVIIPTDLGNLLETGECHDMIVKVGDGATGQEFKVHSQIIGARSKYFRSALSNNQNMKREDGKFYFVKPNISSEVFQIILRYVYGGAVSLKGRDASDILKLVIAVDELLLQKEISDYLQRYLIENKTEWMQQHFEYIHQISFQSDNLLELQRFCTDLMTKSPEKIFKSSSLSEKSLISLIERDDLQMKEIEVWEYILKWGLEKNPTLISDPTIWSDDDFQTMKDTLQHFLPLIRFYSLSSKDFIEKVRPYKKLLKHQLYEDLLKSYLDPNSEPDDNILLPRYKNIDGIIDSKIVNLNIISIISIWFDKIDINSKFTYTRELYFPYKFKLLLRGSKDGFTPEKFHKLCDNKPYTIIFIKLKETGEIIGGYNPLEWKSSGFNIKAKDSFIFSFKNKDNFKNSVLSRVKFMNESLFDHTYCGPSFGNDLYIGVSDNNSSSEYNHNVCKHVNYEKKIRETEDYFLIEDYEVFQIILEQEE